MMNQNKNVLLAAIDNKKDQEDFLEARSSIHIRALVKFVESYSQLKEFLDSPVITPQPNLILLVAELDEPSSMALIKDLKSREAVKKIPLVIVSKHHDEHQLKSAYRLGAASVIKHPTHFESIVKILQIMDEYWFNTVKLPISHM